MLTQLEQIVGKIANAPKPSMPDGTVEEAPDRDSMDMLVPGGGVAYLPAGVVIEYIDDDGQYSSRRVTILTANTNDGNATLTGFCHIRQEPRRFLLSGIRQIVDPLGAGVRYATVESFLDTFRILTPDEPNSTATQALLSAVRHEAVVLIFFARCDGYLHPSERKVMIEFLKGASSAATVSAADGTVEAAWEVIRRLYPDSGTMLESAHAIAKLKGEPGLNGLRNVIRELIEADGIIHNDEALHAIELAYLK